ncbi:MAG: hypothetical protein CVU65_11230 [Deltaproteobacteria bacterium HGW-Deltaproteobacteria-22]|nr:MAG: hypothetical protein CVU65_11230 [Deltaproteobacteria bacterium HGW-Deltaproteobacteria-22]
MSTTRSLILHLLIVSMLLAALSACDDPATKPATDADTDATDLLDADGGDGGVDPNPICQDLGLPTVAFIDVAPGFSLRSTAADFTVATTTGEWTFSTAFTGCDNYLFIQDVPRQEQDWGRVLWTRDLGDLLYLLPRNTHVFFVSVLADDAERAAELAAMQERLTSALGALGATERQWWEGRLHLLTDAAGALPGYLGELMRDPGWGFGIDRFQRIRYIGSYADPSRYDANAQWFGPNLAMAANEAVFYNFEKTREDALLAEHARLVTVFDEVLITGDATATVELPEAALMAGYDTLRLDLTMGCDGDGEFGVCPAWDRIVTLMLCDEDDPDVCEIELGRWITTYHREGRWIIDASALLPLLADGGARRFRFVTSDPYVVSLKLRLADRGRAQRPVAVFPLWTGMKDFNETYNDLFGTISVAIPSTASRVELVCAITGHGMSQPGNCAEFCNTTHTFTVGGQDFVVDYPDVHDQYGCLKQVADGTVPNQYGTWWFGRSGWCPGKEVPLTAFDITSAVTPGTLASFSYGGLFEGAPYSGDNWRYIDLTAWVVIYE